MDQSRRERSNSLDLWNAIDELREELERSFGDVDGYGVATRGGAVPGVAGLLDWQTGPSIDIVEGDEEILVLADVPGVRKQDLDLSVTGNVLSLKGEKRQEEAPKGRKTVRKETWAGSFSRTINLPNTVNPDKVEALLKDGILRVRIAKREEARKKSVQISVK